jgi:hypothetical protein
VWYVDLAVGKNTLSKFMSNISDVGKLSSVYKNHSVRATSITVMDTGGISGRHIIKVSGHKTEASLKSYSHHVCDRKKREISDTLSSALGHQSARGGVDTGIPQLSLDDVSSVFNDDFSLEELDENIASDPNLINILNGPQKRSAVVQTRSQNVIDVANQGLFSFNPRFSDNCVVTININAPNSVNNK